MPIVDRADGRDHNLRPRRPFPAGQRARTRVRGLARRGRAWAGDYTYILREQRAGLADPAVPPHYHQGDRAPVVLIAGIMEPWTLLRPAADRLHRAGHPIHVVEELAYNLDTVAAASDLIAGAIRERELRHVVLLAHSKGGLVGKHVLTHDADGRVDRLIAIATPFGGSSLARYVPLTSVRALRPSDATIVGLSAEAAVNRRIVSVYPSFDPHIPDGSHLDGATNVELPVMGHFRILGDPQVLAVVVAAAE